MSDEYTKIRDEESGGPVKGYVVNPNGMKGAILKYDDDPEEGPIARVRWETGVMTSNPCRWVKATT